jgi:hypothetical protein
VPKVLEDLLWCAALATWLMLFCGFIVTALRPLAKTIRQRLEVELKSKEKHRLPSLAGDPASLPPTDIQS